MAWPTNMSVSKKSFPMIRFHGNRVGEGELVRDASFRGGWGAEMAAFAASHQAPVNPCMSGTSEHEVGPSPGGDCCDGHKCPAFCLSGPAGNKELVFSPLSAEVSNDGEASWDDCMSLFPSDSLASLICPISGYCLLPSSLQHP